MNEVSVRKSEAKSRRGKKPVYLFKDALTRSLRLRLNSFDTVILVSYAHISISLQLKMRVLFTQHSLYTCGKTQPLQNEEAQPRITSWTLKQMQNTIVLLFHILLPISVKKHFPREHKMKMLFLPAFISSTVLTDLLKGVYYLLLHVQKVPC